MLKRKDYAEWAAGQMRRRLGKRRIIEGRGEVSSSRDTPRTTAAPIAPPSPPRTGPSSSTAIPVTRESITIPQAPHGPGPGYAAAQSVDFIEEPGPTPGGGGGNNVTPSTTVIPGGFNVGEVPKVFGELNYQDPHYQYRELSKNRWAGGTLQGAGPTLDTQLTQVKGTWTKQLGGTQIDAIGGGANLKGCVSVNDFTRYGRLFIGIRTTVVPDLIYIGRGTFDGSVFSGYLTMGNPATGDLTLMRIDADAATVLNSINVGFTVGETFGLLIQDDGTVTAYYADNPEVGAFDTTYRSGQVVIGGNAIGTQFANLIIDGWSRL